MKPSFSILLFLCAAFLLQAQTPNLIFSTRGPSSIIQYDLTTNVATPLVLGGLNEVLGVAVDTVERKLYWTDNPTAGPAVIGQSDLNGDNRTTLNISNLNYLTDIAVDYYSRKLLWIDNGAQKIMRANLDGSNPETLRTVQKPVGLAVNCTFNKIYWTEQRANPGGGKIMRMELDGTQPEEVVSYDGRPVKLAFDCIENTFYWSEELYKQIKTSDPGGLNPSTLLSFLGNQRPYGVAVNQDEGIVYWTDVPNDIINGFYLETGIIKEVLTETNMSALLFYSIAPLAVGEAGQNPFDLRIAPNPTLDILSVTLNSPATGSIRSADGRLWKSAGLTEGANNIPVRDIPSGIYVLQIQEGSRISVARFVKM